MNLRDALHSPRYVWREPAMEALTAALGISSDGLGSEDRIDGAAAAALTGLPETTFRFGEGRARLKIPALDKHGLFYSRFALLAWMAVNHPYNRAVALQLAKPEPPA